MRTILIFMTVSLASLAYGSEIKINYSAANDLILTANKCETLLTQHRAICNWKKNLDPSFKLPEIQNISCRKVSNNFSLTVSSCLPEFVKAHQGKKLFKSGANCWGTAMNFKKISNRPRFIWSEEMIYWQNSPVCRKLNPGEKKLPGDIINTYGPEYTFNRSEVTKGQDFWNALYPGRVTTSPVESGYSGYHNFLHSETFVSDELTFGKDSPNQLDKFEFHPMKEVYGRARDVDCQENQTLSPHHREYQKAPKSIKGSKCDYFSLAYRCENFADFFGKQNLNASEEDILIEIKRLQGIQEKLFSLLVVTNRTFPKVELQQMLKEADAMAFESLEELRMTNLDKNHEMLLTWKYFTASGIRKSIELADLTPATEAK